MGTNLALKLHILLAYDSRCFEHSLLKATILNTLTSGGIQYCAIAIVLLAQAFQLAKWNDPALHTPNSSRTHPQPMGAGGRDEQGESPIAPAEVLVWTTASGTQ